MTNQDPITDHEAKIASWRAGATEAVASKSSPFGTLFFVSEKDIDEAVALMRSAPQDGDAKLRELRDWACESSCDTDCGDAVRLPPLLREIDRLLSKPSEPAPSAEIDRLRAENERLRSVLAAVDTSLCRFAQSTTLLVEDDHRGGLLREQRIEGIIDKVRQLELQRSTALDQRDEALAENERLQADLAAARADQAAMARLELDRLLFRYDHGDLGFGPTEPQDLLTDIRQRLAALPAQQPEPKPEVCGATMRIVTGGTCANTKPCPTHDTEPAVQWMAAGPNPYAKTDVDLQAFAVRVLPSTDDEGRVLFVEAIGPVDAHGLPDSVILRITGDMGPGEARYYTMVQPDAATRDGDEVLREWLDPDTEGRPISGWVAVMARVLDEVCRRELARGGK